MMWPFYLMALVAIVSTVRVVTNTNPVHALLSLIVSLLAVAGIFMIVGAPFAAALEIIVYAGAIMVLFLFVIMLMNLNEDTEPQKTLVSKMIAGVIGGVFLAVLVGTLKGAEQMQLSQTGASQIGMVKNLGTVLFKDFLFPFEIASVLLLAALVGAIMLGKKEIK